MHRSALCCPLQHYYSVQGRCTLADILYLYRALIGRMLTAIPLIPPICESEANPMHTSTGLRLARGQTPLAHQLRHALCTQEAGLSHPRACPSQGIRASMTFRGLALCNTGEGLGKAPPPRTWHKAWQHATACEKGSAQHHHSEHRPYRDGMWMPLFAYVLHLTAPERPHDAVREVDEAGDRCKHTQVEACMINRGTCCDRNTSPEQWNGGRQGRTVGGVQGGTDRVPKMCAFWCHVVSLGHWVSLGTTQ